MMFLRAFDILAALFIWCVTCVFFQVSISSSLIGVEVDISMLSFYASLQYTQRALHLLRKIRPYKFTPHSITMIHPPKPSIILSKIRLKSNALRLSSYLTPVFMFTSSVDCSCLDYGSVTCDKLSNCFYNPQVILVK
ncbi:hypothetical protein Trydic_g7878 [Trypoxylus dichotomus]